MSMKCSVEAECGYTLRVEGTSVEYVLARPGGKFNNKKHLSQNHHANFWDFKMGTNKTPGRVITCQRVILINNIILRRENYNGKNSCIK